MVGIKKRSPHPMRGTGECVSLRDHTTRDYDAMARGMGVDVEQYAAVDVKSPVGTRTPVRLDMKVPTTHRFSAIHFALIVVVAGLAAAVFLGTTGNASLDDTAAFEAAIQDLVEAGGVTDAESLATIVRDDPRYQGPDPEGVERGDRLMASLLGEWAVADEVGIRMGETPASVGGDGATMQTAVTLITRGPLGTSRYRGDLDIAASRRGARWELVTVRLAALLGGPERPD